MELHNSALFCTFAVLLGGFAGFAVKNAHKVGRIIKADPRAYFSDIVLGGQQQFLRLQDAIAVEKLPRGHACLFAKDA